MSGPILGIDLGTTNSACGVWQNGAVHLIPNRLGEYLTPSVVGIDDNGLVSVGQVAKEQLLSQPTRTIAAFKRMMGTKHPVKLGKTDYTATELSSIVLRALKEDAENHLKVSISEAVISVPAYFNDNQRYATKEAAELAGLKVSRLINEPTAAALAFGLREKEDGTFIVLDLGGGTFDVSILEYFDDIMEVHASAGDNHLGGEDFTMELMSLVAANASVDIAKLTDKEKAEMYRLSERAKKAVNSGQDYQFQYEDQSQKIDTLITAKTFSEATEALLARVRPPVEKALRDANLTTASINDVLLVGGATRMTNFRSAIGKMFQKIPTSNIDPDLVVAMGAVIQAGLKERDQALDDIVLTDVCPYSLGVEVVSPYNQFEAGYFLPIIERNSTVPVSRVDTLQTVGDNQKMIEVSIFQGESRRTTKNIELGKLRIEVPKKKAGEETVDVRFSYDMNGLLEVDVTVNSSGKVFSKVIEQAPGALTEVEKQKAHQRLASLKFHPREDEQNRAAIARGEALFEIVSGDERNAINAIIAAFENELTSQDALRIERARERLLYELSAYEKSPIL